MGELLQKFPHTPSKLPNKEKGLGDREIGITNSNL